MIGKNYPRCAKVKFLSNQTVVYGDVDPEIIPVLYDAVMQYQAEEADKDKDAGKETDNNKGKIKSKKKR